jgi:CMP-N,N'-diacetyllegionaminic acid synthase
MKNLLQIICFDLDNVICKTKKNNYQQSTPKKNIVKFINNLHDRGFYIKIFTARFMGRYNNVKIARSKGYILTKNQLKKWNLKYNELIMGKPSFDIYIDDKNLGFKKNGWVKQLRKVLILNSQ